MKKAEIVMYLLVLGALPSLAIAGTFQQVVEGDANPEISLVSAISFGTLTVGKTYYYAGNNTPVEASTTGSASGALPIVTASVDTNINARIFLCRPPGSLVVWNGLYSKNLEALTIYYDRDSQYGNGNEVELKDFDPYDTWALVEGGGCGFYYWSGPRDYSPDNYTLVTFGPYDWLGSKEPIVLTSSPLNSGESLYLAIKSDSYGPEQANGTWQVTVGLNVTPA